VSVCVYVYIHLINDIKLLKRHIRDTVLVLINSRLCKEDLISFLVLVFK